MEILQIIDEIEDVVEKSFNIFGFAVTNKEELLSMIDEIRLKLPDELKQARWVKEERQRIISEAQRDAEKIIKDAEDKVIAMIDEHEITKAAKEKADMIMTDAKKQELDMRKNAIIYADSILEKLDKTSTLVLEEIRESRKQLKK